MPAFRTLDLCWGTSALTKRMDEWMFCWARLCFDRDCPLPHCEGMPPLTGFYCKIHELDCYGTEAGTIHLAVQPCEHINYTRVNPELFLRQVCWPVYYNINRRPYWSDL